MIGGNMDMYIFMAIGAIMSMIGALMSRRLQTKAQKYGRIPMRSGLTGAQVAQRMLEHYGIHDVTIVQGQGFLTDHYNPLKKVVSLSPHIYGQNSILSAAVAAHEVGHAVQHHTAYPFLQMRSALVPVVQFSSKIQQFVLMGAFLAIGSGMSWVMLVAIALFAVTALFSLMTLPVEFDATKRGLAWLDASGVSQGEEYEGAKDALKAAAMTYVAAALSALVMVFYLILRYASSSRR